MKGFNGHIRDIRKKGLLRTPVCIESSVRSSVVIGGQRYINFSSNDYLGLSRHRDIVRAAVRSLKRHGAGTGSSRLLSGTYTSHKKLEERIAGFKGTGAALAFTTGYSANTGIIPALADRETVIFSDELNHASIIDGIRISKADLQIYRHKCASHLESLLKERSSGRMKGVRKIVITESVFSMGGDIAPLDDIVFLCRRYGALLMVDDAHATGVIGRTGRGGLEHFGVSGDGTLQMGTLSKAVGCCGGFAAGSREIIDLLINRARTFMFSTSLPPAVADACIKAIDIISTRSGHIRKRLWKNRQQLYEGLNTMGFDTLESETPVIPLFIGDMKRTVRMAKYLFREKIFAPAIRPPSVPDGKCRIRFSVTASHTNGDIEYVLAKLKKFKM